MAGELPDNLFKQTLVKTSEAERTFRQEIDDIRRSQLGRLRSSRVSRGLLVNRVEAHILKAIVRLKNQVKNGTLPVKTTTNAFNRELPSILLMCTGLQTSLK